MVGVASSLGCAACRKQKKKCIAEDNHPPCQRCKRLNIDCLELGQRRLKFQSENDKFALLKKEGDCTDNVTTEAVTASKGYRFAKGVLLNRPQTVFTNEEQGFYLQKPITSALTRLQAGYVRMVDTNVDVALQMSWNYGPYLEQVPLYLGRSKAFDAAAEALIENYSCLRRNIWSGRDKKALGKYSKALNGLRDALANRREATSTETLAAIGMLMVFESMAGFGPKSVLTHAGGAAKVFKERGQILPKNEFEALLQLSLRGGIVMQALFLPFDYFTNDEWSALTQSKIGATSPEEKAFRCFAVYARLLHIVQPILAEQHVYDGYDEKLENLWKEAEVLKRCLDVELVALRQTFWYLTRVLSRSEIDSTRKAGKLYPDASGTNTYHAHIGRSYGFALGNHVLINSMIQALVERIEKSGFLSKEQQKHSNQDLKDENEDLARECCHLARAVDCHRPLGTIYMAGVLRFASVGAAGQVNKPVKALSMDKFGRPSEFHAPILSAISGRDMITEDSLGIQDWMSSGNVVRPDDDLTVLDELTMLLIKFQSDFGEASSKEELEHGFVWLKRRFTFRETQLDTDKALV